MAHVIADEMTSANACGLAAIGGSRRGFNSTPRSGALCAAHNTGTDYYAGFTSIYTNLVVANMPDNATTGNKDVISLDEEMAFTNTLTFSQPLVNPIMDLVSLGPGPVTYNFNTTPNIPANDVLLLSQGAVFFNGCSTCLTLGNNTITGNEGDGVIEFVGTLAQSVGRPQEPSPGTDSRSAWQARPPSPPLGRL
jgi:hypothetical protein